jgi:5-hydroxyisourate hydrolase
MSHITTHVLDTAKGKPAEGIKIILYRQQEQEWLPIANGITSKDGRIADLLEKENAPDPGLYKMEFFTKDYFDHAGLKSFYPLIPIIFEITSKEHYHIPLLLSPFGYTTYRGS